MIKNRWVLFAICFGGMMVLQIVFFPDSRTSLIEQIIFTLLNAAVLAYLYKYFNRILAYLIPKIVLWVVGAKPKDK